MLNCLLYCKMKNLFSLLFFCCLSGWFAPALAQSDIYTPTEADMNNTMERFLHFHVDIDIKPDGNAVFTENFTVYAAGIEIRKGIIRNILEYRIDKTGRKKIVPIKVLNVMLDGKDSEFRTETRTPSKGREQLIYTNESDNLLRKGFHRFTIVYESRGHVGFFDDYDEMYWNVMGSDCVFSIENISATLHPPGGSEAIKWSCYTGVEGSTEMACNCNGDVVAPFFKATRVLQPGEGFSIAVSFPRDIIQRPTKSQEYWEMVRSAVIGLIIVMITGMSMFFMWFKYGRDAGKQLIYPQFRPPNNWSPAKVRYLYKQKFDDKAFTATLLQMAVKRGIGIEYRQKKGNNKKKCYYLVPKNKNNLNEIEQTMFDKIFSTESQKGKEGEVLKEREVSAAGSTYLSSAMISLDNSTTSGINFDDYYKENKKYIYIGMIMSISLWIVHCFVAYNDTYESSSIVFVPLTLILFYQIFRKVMGARTKLGAQTVAELAGLRMYLGTSERYWLNQMMPPEQTPQHFEEMLPYAVALNVENQWCDKFHNVLQRYNYTPVWYSDTDYSSDSLTGFFSSKVYTSLNNSVRLSGAYNRWSSLGSGSSSSSSGSSSWSSGSSGGGYSGGGGGGGGARGY